MRLSNNAVLLQTGHFHVGLRSFICKNITASKHCTCAHVDALVYKNKTIKDFSTPQKCKIQEILEFTGMV